jgi:ZIP family zinc transporter
VTEAFLNGLVGASSLVIGALYALWRPIPRKPLGLIMAFGAGILLSSVAYELIGEAILTSDGDGGVAIGLMAGAITFFVGDLLIERSSKKKEGAEGANAGLAVVLGTVLDGIPESVVLGVGLVSADPSAAMLVAVFVSNLPESMASTTDLRRAGWTSRSLLLMWTGIVLVSALSAGIGYSVFGDASDAMLAFVLAYAGGAILTMLADSMMPEAFAESGPLTGVITSVGFGIGVALSIWS